MKCKLKKLEHLANMIDTHLFSAVVGPILTYGTNFCGVNRKGTGQIDKLCLGYSESILGLKPSTGTYMVWGELGYIPASVECYIKILHYYDKHGNLPDSMLVKHAYNEYLHIHGQGFNTWFSYVWEIASKDEFNIETTTSSFRHTVKKHFVNYQKKL